MSCRLPNYDAPCAQGRGRHSWNPGRRKQRCDYCRVDRATWSKRYRFCDPLERALQDLASYGLVEVRYG